MTGPRRATPHRLNDKRLCSARLIEHNGTRWGCFAFADHNGESPHKWIEAERRRDGLHLAEDMGTETALAPSPGYVARLEAHARSSLGPEGFADLKDSQKGSRPS